MKEFAVYSLQVNALLIVSYLLYKMLLSNESSFKANRVYLIMSAVLSLLIPFIHIPAKVSSVLGKMDINEVVISKINSQILTNQFSFTNLISILYITGIAIAALMFLKNIFQILSLVYKGNTQKKDGYILVQSKRAEGVFSFLKFMFIPAEKQYPESEILQHELTHIKQLHSLDVLFFETLSILFWYNPVCYLYKRAIKENHEFLADEAVVKANADPQEYSKLIVSYALDVTPYALSGNFISKSFLKKRIIMLGRRAEGSKRFILKYALVILLLPFVFLLNSSLKGNDPQVKGNPVSTASVVDSPPKFENLNEFIQKNIKYPDAAKKNHIEGTVYVGFIVDENGKVQGAHVLKGPDKDLNDEALRVINLMPAWTPAQKDGKSVSFTFYLPLHFELK